MIKIFLLAVVASAVGLAVYLFFYLGFYKPVEISIEKRGPMYLLSKHHTGPYHEIGPSIAEVEAWAAESHVPCEKTYGEYLDNPDAVDQDRLRSQGGCVLNGPLQQVPPQFQFEERGGKSYVVGRFYGSPSIGPMKVYPKIRKYLAEQQLRTSEAVIETYVIKGSKVETEYLFSLQGPPPNPAH